MKKELITFRNPKSPVSETFRTLRTNIQFMNANKKLKTLLVTSTLPGEGKSWVASNLATTFAQAGKSVVLIDADMRKGRQYSIFGVSPRPGLSNYLAMSKEDCGIDEIEKYIQNTEVEGLFLIPAGNVPPNPSELLITPQMTNLLDKLSEKCDIVIVDAPPSELVTDAAVLSRIVDSTIIVTAHKQTKKANLQRTIKSIKNVGGNIAGVVLNKVPIDGKRYEKSYYYGSQMVSSTKKKDNDFSVFDRNTRRHSEEETNKETKKEEVENTNETSKVEETSKIEKTVETSDPSTINTEKILKQVNEYLEKEKSNLRIQRGEDKK